MARIAVEPVDVVSFRESLSRSGEKAKGKSEKFKPRRVVPWSLFLFWVIIPRECRTYNIEPLTPKGKSVGLNETEIQYQDFVRMRLNRREKISVQMNERGQKSEKELRG